MPELVPSLAVLPVDLPIKLKVPDPERQQRRIITLEGNRLVESGRCVLPATASPKNKR